MTGFAVSFPTSGRVRSSPKSIGLAVSLILVSNSPLYLLISLISNRVNVCAASDGTLRWQAPELMAGQSDLTPAVDVYAFAICCVEVMTNGGLPWPHADDDTVRQCSLS